MIQQPDSCIGCPLHDQHIGIGFMNPDGTGSNGVLILLEALGKNEAWEGLPIRPDAPAGSVFNGILRRIPGADRKQFLLSNTIWCQPGKTNWLDGAPYEFAAIEHCQQYNQELIRARRPRAIVTMGAIPTRTVTGMAGRKQNISLIRGFIIPSSRPEYYVDGKPIPVIPTFHPSHLMRSSKTRSKNKEEGTQEGGKVQKAFGGMNLVGVVSRDIKLAMAIAAGKWPTERRKFDVVKGNRDVMAHLIRLYKEHPEWDLFWDIETPFSIKKLDETENDLTHTEVSQIQFAYDSQTGYVFPGFNVGYVLEGTKELMSLPNRKISWNGHKFDTPVIGGNGVGIEGINLDLMQAWGWIEPDLPKALQFATSFAAPNLPPWKHMSGDADDIYGACDVISLAILRDYIFGEMEKEGLKQSFERHVIKLGAEMKAASVRGFPVDSKKHNEWGGKVDVEVTELEEKVRALVPEHLLNCQPKAGYVRTPKQILPFLDAEGHPLDGTDRVLIAEELEDGTGDESGENGGLVTVYVPYVRRRFTVLDKKSGQDVELDRWCKLIPFSVGSRDQKIRYINFKREIEIEERMRKGQTREKAERLAKYKVPLVRNKQKELKENTGMKEFERLYKATEDPVFKLLIEVNKLRKLRGTYGPYIHGRGWKVVDDKVHTTFGMADTGTGQLSSTNPNIQNAPKHGDLAKEFRAIVGNVPGRRIVELDKKAFHAQTLALEAKDKKYARIAAIDPHSYVTAWRLKLPEAPQLLSWSDSDLKDWIKKMKADPRIYQSEAIPNIPGGLTFQQVRDYKAKRVVLGIGFKQGPLSIYEQNPESYKGVKEVQEFLDVFLGQFDKVKDFHNEITRLAHKQTYLKSKWGYIRRFYDVFQWDPKKYNQFSGTMGDWRHGDDFEAAVAFLPANDAFGMLKEEMLRCAGYRSNGQTEQIFSIKLEEDLLEKYNFVNQIHDSLIFFPERTMVDRCLEEVGNIMREPCLTLADPEMCPNGFFVDVDAKVGECWVDASKKYPTGMRDAKEWI
jgi:uracil-DNA glycosylase family 4